MNASCTICQELFTGSEVSAAPCGHTFHYLCILQWIERSKSCPTCRQKATQKSILRLFFNSCSTTATQIDPEMLNQKVDNLTFQLHLKTQECKTATEELDKFNVQVKGQRMECKELEKEVRLKTSTISALKSQLLDHNIALKDAKEAKQKLSMLHRVKTLVDSCDADIESTMASYLNPTNENVKALVTMNCALKKSLNQQMEDKRNAREESSELRTQARQAKQKVTQYQQELAKFQDVNEVLQQDLKSQERIRISLQKKVQSLQEAVVSPSGDVKNSAIQRLLAESPAPQELKMMLHHNEETFTPEILKTVSVTNKKDVKGSDEVMNLATENLKVKNSLNNPQNTNKLFIKDNNLLTKKTFFKRGSSGINKQFSNPSMKRNHGEVGYDGLGGHHMPDIFPVPKYQNFTKSQPHKKLLNIKPNSTISISSNSIKDFFTETFD